MPPVSGRLADRDVEAEEEKGKDPEPGLAPPEHQVSKVGKLVREDDPKLLLRRGGELLRIDHVRWWKRVRLLPRR
jgi:hypothetical protein